MTVYAWPDVWTPQTLEAQLVPNIRSHTSQYTGSEQVIDLLGERWRFAFMLPERRMAKGAAIEAFMGRLLGPRHKVSLWHFARPVPRGSLRGAPTLASSAAQGASQIVISGVGRNLLLRPQELDHATWTKSDLTVTANAIADPLGASTAEKLVEAATTAAHFVSQGATLVAGAVYTFSVYVKAAERTRMGLIVRDVATSANQARASWNLSSGAQDFGGAKAVGTYTDAVAGDAVHVGGGWYRCTLSMRVGAASAVQARLYLLDASTGINAVTYAGDGTSGLYAWGLQVEEGAAASEYEPGPRLLAGDMLGLGGMLLMVAADAAGTGDGTLTVDLVNRLRVAQSSGAAITWDKPTAEFRLQGGSPSVGYRPGAMQPLQVEFMESWTT